MIHGRIYVLGKTKEQEEKKSETKMFFKKKSDSNNVAINCLVANDE